MFPSKHSIAGFGIYVFASLHFAYSTGERVGFVQKISKKGWLCKTDEGELSMVNMAGQQAEMFDFTVRNDAIVQKIEAFNGHRVTLRVEIVQAPPEEDQQSLPYMEAHKVDPSTGEDEMSVANASLAPAMMGFVVMVLYTLIDGAALLSAWPVRCLVMTAMPSMVWCSTESTRQAIFGALAGTAP